MKYILRLFYIHRVLDNATGHFTKTQESRDFPGDTDPKEAQAQLEAELGNHADDSWKARGGFVTSFWHQLLSEQEKPQGCVTEQQIERIAEDGQLFSGMDMKQLMSTKPKTKLPK